MRYRVTVMAEFESNYYQNEESADYSIAKPVEHAARKVLADSFANQSINAPTIARRIETVVPERDFDTTPPERVYSYIED